MQASREKEERKRLKRKEKNSDRS